MNTSPIGVVIYAADSSVQHCNYLLIDSNSAGKYAVMYLYDSKFGGCDSENIVFLNNLGSLVVFNSNITFTGIAVFLNNQP